MTTNAGVPFQICVYDAVAARVVRAVVLLGPTKKQTLNAARRGIPAEGLVPKWSAADGAALRRRFGPSWRRALTPNTALSDPGSVLGGDRDLFAVEPDSASDADSGAAGRDVTAHGAVLGGAPDIFGDMSDFDSIDEVTATTDASPHVRNLLGMPPAPLELPAATREHPPIEYSEVRVDSGDTFADLKQKVYVAAGIPPYRQHLFYFRGESPHTTYRLSVDGVTSLVDIRDLGARAPNASVAGVPVDRALEANRDRIHVRADDEFVSVGAAGVRRIFVADLQALLAAHAERLQTALSDAYQRDLIYYGAVLKFWPELTFAAFNTLVSEPDEFRRQFPRLHPSAEAAKARVEAMQRAVAAVDGARAQRISARSIAVTSAAASLAPLAARVVADLQSIVNSVGTSVDVPAIRARMPENGGSPSSIATDFGQHSGPIMVTKLHVSAEQPRIASALAHFLTAVPPTPQVAFALLQRPSGQQQDLGRPRFLFMVVFPDGSFAISGDWREDSRLDIAAATNQLTQMAAPLVAQINRIGPLAFPAGGGLNADADDATASKLTVSYFWPRILTGSGFRALKTRWRLLEAAGIISVRSGLHVSGAFVSHFHRGAMDYDRASAERSFQALAARGRAPAGLMNRYAHLSDAVAEQAWQTAFPGRAVRMTHRMTDLRVEIVGASHAELDRILRYVLVFLDGLSRGSDRLSAKDLLPPNARAAPERRDGSRLQALQEQDPELYDLKKFDEKATVYSVLCQGARQPVIVDPHARRKTDVAYWNFTYNRPEYYRCPSQKFPHLGLKGDHPLGRCLPCCRKAPPPQKSRAAAEHAVCSRDRVVAEGAVAAELGSSPLKSRHVLAAGKSIPPGRFSLPPPLLSSHLLYGTTRPGLRWLLVGVRQRLPSIPDAGFFFALAALVRATPTEFADELAATAASLGPAFRGAGYGGGARFSSAAELAAVIAETFHPTAATFTPFSPGGGAHDVWRRIVADLAFIRYGVAHVVFELRPSENTVSFDGEAELVVDPSVAVLVARPVRLGIVVSGPQGVYPLVASGGAKAATDWVFEAPGELAGPVDVIRAMIADAKMPTSDWSLEAVAGALGEDSGASLDTYLIDIRGSCYGATVKGSSGAAYLPVPRTTFVPAGTAGRAVFDARPNVALPAAALAAVLHKLSGAGVAPGSYTERLVNVSGDTVGFVADGLSFHHDPTAAPPALWRKLPTRTVYHDSRAIDRSIVEAAGRPAALPEQHVPAAAAARRSNTLFRMFAAEFAAALAGERDEKTRKSVLAAVLSARFGAAAGAERKSTSLRNALDELLGRHTSDRREVELLMSRARAVRSQGGTPAAAATHFQRGFDASAFDFDRQTLAALRAQPLAECEASLARIMRGRVALGAARPANTNTAVACSLSGPEQAQCVGGRLAVTPAEFPALVSILAATVRDPLGRALQTAVAADPSLYTVRPGERVVAEPIPNLSGRYTR